jgi:hypothetical protein
MERLNKALQDARRWAREGFRRLCQIDPAAIMEDQKHMSDFEFVWKYRRLTAQMLVYPAALAILYGFKMSRMWADVERDRR